MNEHRPNSIAAFVNAFDQPLFGLIILGVWAFTEIAGREVSGTQQMVLGAVITYFFRPKSPSLAAPKSPEPPQPPTP